MTKFSDWELIPTKDRKCYLPPDTQVQTMWRQESVSYAEAYGNIMEVSRRITDDNTWFAELFAYRRAALDAKESE